MAHFFFLFQDRLVPVDWLLQRLIRCASLEMELETLWKKGAIAVSAWFQNVLVPVAVSIVIVFGYCGCSR